MTILQVSYDRLDVQHNQLVQTVNKKYIALPDLHFAAHVFSPHLTQSVQLFTLFCQNDLAVRLEKNVYITQSEVSAYIYWSKTHTLATSMGLVCDGVVDLVPKQDFFVLSCNQKLVVADCEDGVDVSEVFDIYVACR